MFYEIVIIGGVDDSLTLHCYNFDNLITMCWLLVTAQPVVRKRSRAATTVSCIVVGSIQHCGLTRNSPSHNVNLSTVFCCYYSIFLWYGREARGPHNLWFSPRCVHDHKERKKYSCIPGNSICRCSCQLPEVPGTT